jgi:dTDP-4-dehydrorhamnose 3,5-epimerase-like enzyme
MNIIRNKMIDLKVLGDGRGNLIPIESGHDINFDIKRVYYLFGMQDGVVRGLHAHKKLKQLLVVTSGSCKVVLDNGLDKQEYVLSSPEKGLLIGPNTWREMSQFSQDCVVMVLASEHYDEGDYIRNYGDFLEYIADKTNG